MTNETNPKLLIAIPPTLCDKCGQQLIAQAHDVDDGITQILHFCPHNKVLAHATLEEIEGSRAISKWILEGPASQEYAIAMAEKLGESQGAEMEILNSGRVH